MIRTDHLKYVVLEGSWNVYYLDMGLRVKKVRKPCRNVSSHTVLTIDIRQRFLQDFKPYFAPYRQQTVSVVNKKHS